MKKFLNFDFLLFLAFCILMFFSISLDVISWENLFYLQMFNHLICFICFAANSSGNNSFRRVIGKDQNYNVKESLYLNFETNGNFLF
ncbi:MAG: hypothetical protein IKP65_01205 [Alphaproteobacteria bacterium]|nr:hypothetical protein [Alphaproteobacteria bacterium]